MEEPFIENQIVFQKESLHEPQENKIVKEDRKQYEIEMRVCMKLTIM